MNKIIISDTSCLIALDRIGRLDILNKVFNTIYTTETVAQEFEDPLPNWILVQSITDNDKLVQLKLLLDPGEASAIVLALETDNSVLIIDEKKGRKIATELNLAIIGTLKVLLIAKNKGIISSVNDVVLELQGASFRFNKIIVQEILKLAGEK
jgi:predicted nucleic acid-binding protein